MKNKFSKFINLQGKYLTSLLIALVLGVGQMWATTTGDPEVVSFTSGNITAGYAKAYAVTTDYDVLADGAVYATSRNAITANATNGIEPNYMGILFKPLVNCKVVIKGVNTTTSTRNFGNKVFEVDNTDIYPMVKASSSYNGSISKYLLNNYTSYTTLNQEGWKNVKLIKYSSKKYQEDATNAAKTITGEAVQSTLYTQVEGIVAVDITKRADSNAANVEESKTISTATAEYVFEAGKTYVLYMHRNSSGVYVKEISFVPVYQLTWNFDEGSSSETAGTDYTAAGYYVKDATLAYPSDESMSKDGFVFDGWSSSATTMPASALTITAQWAAAGSCVATAPGAITKGIASEGVLTLTAEGTPADNNTWYWQDAADGTATDKGSGATKNVNAAGTYYLRSFNDDGGSGCWSAAKSVTVVAADLLTAINPSLSYDANVFTGGTLNPTLTGNTGNGTVTYALNDVTPEGCMTIDGAGVVTAVAAGTATVTATISANGYYAGGEATSGTITVIPAPTHMVENRLVITNGASWGSSIYTTDGTNITNLSAFNPSRTGEGAINVNKKTANGSRSTNISSYTSENADNYMVLSFTVADGKRLRVSAVNIQPYSVSDTKHHRAWLADANGNKIVEATADLDKDGVANVFANVDFSENAVYLTGTNYLKLWTWGSENGYRLNTPIYIDGVISDIPATYSVTYVPNNSITPAETMTDSNSPYEAGAEVTLLSNTFTAPTGQLFDGWVATYNDGENNHELTITNGKFTMPAYNVTVTAQWADASATYDITYVSAHGTAPAVANAASATLAELSESGWQHVGWTADVDVTVDAETVTAGTLIANGKTAILASDVTFTAVWNQIYTVTYNANGGTCATSEATWKAGDDALVLPAATKDNFDFVGWYDAATGGNKIGNGGANYTPAASIELFAHYMPKLVQAIYSNTFDAFIKNQAVTVYYLQGEAEPTLTSIKVLGIETPNYTDNGSSITITISDVDYIFPVTKTAVAPYTGTGSAETFNGQEPYIKTGYSYNNGWRFSKTDSDWSRESDGRTRIYFFLAANEQFTLTSTGDARKMKVYRNGVKLDSPTSSGSNPTILGTNTPAMYAIVSDQGSGDGKFTAITIKQWVPVESIVLKEGTTEITSKEIAEGAQFTLTAEVTPADASNPNIIWESANALIASVDGGVVTGEASGGPVNIIARSQDNNTIYATCAVTVAAPCTPSMVAWNVEPADGVKGGNGSASVTTNYEAGLEVTSSDPTVASVSNDGVNITINYLKKGTTKITATVVGDGSTYCNTPVSVEKTITVAPDCPAVGNLFSLEFKNISTSYAVQKGQDNETVEIPSSDADITGGKAFVGTTSNSTGQSIAVTNGDCKFGTSSNFYVRLEVECPLQVGDIISYTSSSDKSLNFYKDNMSGTSVASSNYKVTVATGSPLIGAEVIYIKRSNSANTIMTLSIDRPAQITLNGNGGKIDNETEVVVPAVGATQLPNARKAGDFYFVGWALDQEGNNMVANPYTPTATTVTLYAQYDDCVAQGTVYKFEVATRANGVYIFENGSSFPASLAMTTDNYLSTLVGGDLTASVTSSSGNYQNIYIDNSGVAGVTAFMTQSSYGVLTMDLGCPLKAGDVFRYNIVSDNSKKLTLKDDDNHSMNILGNNADEVDEMEVPATWVGATQLTLNYNGGPCRIASFEVYRPNKYDVTFNMMGHGSQVAAIEGVFENHKITAPTAPTNEDYAFAGWYKENTLENEWDFANDVVTAATTLYAKWLDKSDATLKSLKYGTTDIELQAGVYTYNVELPSLTTAVPALAAETSNPNATKAITNGTFDEAGNATSTVVVTPQKEGAATQTYTVNFAKAAVVTLKNVTGSTTWDFTGAVTADVTIQNTLTVIANYAGVTVDDADKMEVKGTKFMKSPACVRANQMHFYTTVPGKLTVEYSNTGGNTVRYLYVNGAKYDEVGSENTTKKGGNNSVFVPAGDVNLAMMDGSDVSKELNIYTVTFDATPDYTRDLMLGNGVYGTLCVKYNVPVAGINGATFYEFQGRDANNYGKLVFDEVVSGELTAGTPYVFQAHGDIFTLFYGSTKVDDPVNENGMYGTFTDITLTELDGVYYFAQRALWSCDDLTSLSIPANRAYVKLSEMGYLDTNNSSPAPGRRRITMAVNGEQTATGIENGGLINDENGAQKVLIDGQLFILRGEKMFDATGRLVK